MGRLIKSQIVMKKIVAYIAVAVLIFTACEKEKEVLQETKDITLTAVMERPIDGATKTVLTGGSSVYWDSEDAISVFTTTENENAMFTTSQSGGQVEFTGSASGTPLYAIYPYDSWNTIDGSTIKFKLPSTQNYKTNSFGSGANVSVGQFDGSSIKFYNTCGVLRLSLSIADGDAATVGKIVLTDENNYLTGTFTADASSTTPTATYFSAADDGGNVITLNCGVSGVALSTSVTDFYIVVPNGSLSGGFTAKVYSLQGHLIKTLTTANSQTIARAHIKPMAAVTNIPWLPVGYAECEYIENTNGTETLRAYINTEMSIDNYFSVELDMSVLAEELAVGKKEIQRVIMGVYAKDGEGSQDSQVKIILENTGSGTVIDRGNVFWSNQRTISLNAGTARTTFAFGERNTILWENSADRTALYKNGEVVGTPSTTALSPIPVTHTRPLYLFALDDYNNPMRRVQMRLYEGTLSYAGAVVRHFVPVLCTSGTYNGYYGLYEVSKTHASSYTGDYFYISTDTNLFGGH